MRSAKRFLSQATARNAVGLDPYLNVIVAQVSLLDYQQTYVGFQTQQNVASVQLIQAWGADGTSPPYPHQSRFLVSRSLPGDRITSRSPVCN